MIYIEELIKIIGIGIFGLILVIIIKQYRPEFTLFVSLISGLIILLLILDKFIIIINLLKSICQNVNINNTYIKILLKITGIAILTEFAVNICKDSGENSIASKIELGSKVIIIVMSIPIISDLLQVIIKILP